MRRDYSTAAAAEPQTFSQTAGKLSNWWPLCCRLAGVLFLVPAFAYAQSDYYKHLIFDNSLTPERYYYSEGRVSGSSRLMLDRNKLPVETKTTFTPPNALRLQWRSAPDGGWEAALRLDRWRNREVTLDGDTLYFWCFSREALPAARLPRLQLRDSDHNFTAPLGLERLAGAIPAGKWVQVKVPLRRFATASLRPFDPRKVQSVYFLQGAADGAEHTLIIDEIKIDFAPSGEEAPPAAPKALRAKGYDRHIDLSWQPNAAGDLQRYVIYRSFDGTNYVPVGIQSPGFSRYTDFLGEPNRKAYYKIKASDRGYRESAFSEPVSAATRALSDDELLTMVQEASFRYYWEGAHPIAGMALENIPGADHIVATGASGFGVMALLVGIERGFITRAQGAARFLKIVEFLEKADRFHGVWPHFLDGRTGKTLPVFGMYDNGGDLVETAFLMQGLLAARQYFKGGNETERRIYEKITRLWETVEWEQYRTPADKDFLFWHWSPDYKWSDHRLIGWNETMIVYLLAMASPTHGVPAGMYYTGWASQSDVAARYRQGWGETTEGDHYVNGNTYHGIKLDVGVGSGGPLFFTHYSFLGFDPRGLRDRYTNYFDNNRNIALINRAYCIANPEGHTGYGSRCWGLTASDGPWGYAAHEPKPKQDTGTMTPTGALASFPYTPEASMEALKYFYQELGPRLWDVYGFRDAFNLKEGWVSQIFMGLNQAPIAVMIENHRTGLLWKLFMANPEIRPMLERAGFTASAAAPAPSVAKSDVEQRVNDLLARMTLEEKLGQLQQLDGHADGNYRPEHVELIRKGLLGSTLNVRGAKRTNELQRIAVGESRLKIPMLFAFDVIHGYRTVFPVPLGMAASWDPAAVERAAGIAAAESAATGVKWTFAPMVDIARDARWGRIVEGAGEDPYLGSVMARAQVRGFQGNDYSAPDKVVACAKHWVAYGAAEAGRDYNTTEVSERTLREVYFPPFKAAVEAGVGTFMSAFNDLNGVPTSANPFTLERVLRDEWKFDGIVVSDYESVRELMNHGIAATEADAARAALTAGVDMEMVSRLYNKHGAQLVKEGKLPLAEVDEAVRRVLRIKFRLGLFDKPYTDEGREAAVLLSREHVAAAREIAARSMVLLKNDRETLPLSKEVRSVAVIGPLADDQAAPLGSWTGDGRKEDAVTLLAGIKAKVPATTRVSYAKGCEIAGDATEGFAEAARVAREADVAIVAVGETAEMSGEASSRSTLDLPGRQLDLVKAVMATGKPVVVVLMNGRPLAINWMAENVPAILETWFAGTQAGHAIADVLFGDVNPGGKLPVTFPRTVGQAPIYYNHKNTGRPPDEKNKYTSKYLDVPWTPLFPFGHGLSYTQFRLANLQVSERGLRPEGQLKVSVEVENTGRRAGDEVVQLYIRDMAASVTRPVKELKGFERVTLRPGERRRVEFTLTAEHLGFYNQDMRFVVEPGTFKVMVGTSSVGGLEARFEVTAN